MNRIKINLDKKISRSYDLYIGKDIQDRATLLIARGNWAKRYFLITDTNVSDLHGSRVLDTFRNMGMPVEMITFPAGEASKTIHTAVAVAEELLGRGADRTSGLIALGGGVVGDLTGFIASIFMRGKTGVDLPMAKNMLGTFCQPKAVFTDVAFLKTLPVAEYMNGLAEIVKCAIIDDPGLLDLLEEQAVLLMNVGEPEPWVPIVTRACEIKKKIVEIDEKEQGLRRILNFGHTLGHAVEAEADYAIPHGEAVSMGMAGALILSEKLGHLPVSDRERIMGFLQKAGLPVRIPGSLSTEGVISRMQRDKKKEGKVVHFVLLRRLGMPFVNGGVPESLIRETIEGLKK
jgi:3-dehydroquinate synthase